MYFTDEQKMIQEMVGKLARDKIEPLVKEADASGHSSSDIVKILAKNNLLKMALPESYGGIGANYTTIALAKKMHNVYYDLLSSSAEIGVEMLTFFWGIEEAKEGMIAFKEKRQAVFKP